MRILEFHHSDDCKYAKLSIKRKEAIKTFEIKGNSGWETTEKINKLINCFLNNK